MSSPTSSGGRIQPFLPLCGGTEWQPGHLALQGGPCPALALLAARGLCVKEALEEVELQHPGEDNDTALGH